MEKSKQQDIIFGLQPVLEAVKSGKDVEKIFFRKGGESENMQELRFLAQEYRIPYQLVPQEKLDRFTRKNHQGVVARVSPISFHSLGQLIPTLFEKGRVPFIVMLDRVTDVRNFGAIARTAECAGADALVVPFNETAQLNADAMKTSAGALHHLPVCREISMKKAVQFIKNSGILVYAATEKAGKLYHEIDYTSPVAIVLGSEEKGVSSSVFSEVDGLLKIPMEGRVGSLNVSAAASILMYEVVRQRFVTR